MKEPHKKGVATHLDPESCAGARKGCRLYVSSAQFGTTFAPGDEVVMFEKLHFMDGICNVQGIGFRTRWN